jgi:preprotein translocase subunit SecF
MVRNRKIAYIFSGILVLASFCALIIWGLRPGIDFTGGSLLEANYPNNRPDIAKIQASVNALGLGNVSIQLAGESGIIVRSKDLSQEEHQKLLTALNVDGKTAEEKNFNSIGPVIGKELRQKSWIAIIIVAVMIIFYIAFAFRKVSRPFSSSQGGPVVSWKYGIVAVLALIHDVTIPAGAFAVLGHFKGIEVDTLFITALLTTLGFSVHDTIVVFDRIRENLKKQIGLSFDDTVEASIRQTMARSIITSMTVVFVLVALLILGPASTKYFSLALLIGVVFGTYSSICLASPLLVSWKKWSEKKKLKK